MMSRALALAALAGLVSAASPDPARPSDAGPVARPDPGTGAAVESIAVPAGWKLVAELAPDRPADPEGTVRVESRAAYGDPAHGCFALVQRVSAPSNGFDQRRAIEVLHAQLRAAGWTAGPVEGADLPFAGGGFQGIARAKTESAGGERAVVLSVACFYNDREPDMCRPACDAVLDSAGVER